MILAFSFEYAKLKDQILHMKVGTM